jgi:hypothetical protein
MQCIIKITAFTVVYPNYPHSYTMKIRLLSSVCLFAMCAVIPPVHGQETPVNTEQSAKPVPRAALMGLAQDFVKRISKGFEKADKAMRPKGDVGDVKFRLPEGEELLLTVRLADRLLLENQMFARVQNGEVVLSLRDFFAVLELPITLHAETGEASGWYIRENKTFAMDYANRSVRTDNGDFSLSDKVMKDGDEVYVPVPELASWLGFKMELKVGALEIKLTTPMPLPIQERLERQSRDFKNKKVGPAEMPLIADNQTMIEMPVIDVLTRSSYRRAPGKDSQTTANASVSTAGDFAYGTLTTQSNYNKEDKLTSARVKYMKQSLEKELLGPLKARKFELGDVSTTRMPLDDRGRNETGVRITNAHPLRSTLRPSTVITGSTFPGWDVELYRDDQLLSFQTVGDDGIYTFDDVSLFRTDNNFRIVQYGLQGEIREEELYVPVDNRQLAEQGTAYDMSLSFQNTQAYNRVKNDDVDKGAPHFAATYEMPVGDVSAASAGVESREVDGERISSVQAGYSTEIASTLLNLDGAVDSNGEMGAQLVARRNFGEHQFRNEIDWATVGYGLENLDDPREVFSENFGVYGPLPLPIGRKPRYNFNFDYGKSSTDFKTAVASAGLSTSWRRLSLNQQFEYDIGFEGRENFLDGVTTLTTAFGPNRIQGIATYNIRPDPSLEELEANWRRRLTRDLDAEVAVNRSIESRHTELRGQLNWDAKVARISPSVSYDTEREFVAGLTTRFGLARDPLREKIFMYSNPSTTNGSMSVFVFLDANGDGQYNEGEEPIPEAKIQSLQTGGRQTTDEDGFAFFPNMRDMMRTDVYLDPESLQDPYWVPGAEGVSVLPRSGHVASLEFPVHNAGEMDGTLFLHAPGSDPRVLNGVRLALYDEEGEAAMSSVTAPDGYYLFSKIPPGQYTLVINSDDATARKFVRPDPQTVTIGYDGTMIYGNDLNVYPGFDIATVILQEAPEHAPSIAPLLKPGTVILNLGDYNSRMLMGLMWYRLKLQYADALAGAKLLIPATASNASPKTGKHTLRVVLAGETQKDGIDRCKQIAQGGFICKVEMLAEKMKLASAQ